MIEGNNTTLLNVNDSKTFGQSMKQILCNHPKIDFAFKLNGPTMLSNEISVLTTYRP